MTDTASLEQLQSQLLTGGGDSSTNPFAQVLEPLMPLLAMALAIGAALSAVFVVYVIVTIIQKQRQHAAIMRIDRNLQKLVDTQTPAVANEKLAVRHTEQPVIPSSE